MQNYHLSPADGRWVLREEGSDRAVLEAATKEEAVTRMREYMQQRTGSVKIHGRDGRVEEERTYPRDLDPRASMG
ncbi:DUF2188 domain-containing protein [Pseudomonas indica]|uniref:DUF2188 domain-containing protein n=1 Tax=Pseudomonas indica TaxID=137658 RepID=A0A1G9KFF8_9PSED|nr:DUF2188 domain-containing protein [Pseudomonas indica]MBU3055254.1 DUF2188 domain-containing protein [Pseudomonas indica]PAU61507.1 hypothetical protein BZL42_07960 [Pseudomonas indica]SDL48538.1 hypothetical protein SAMN05216186_12235 [Pseudomonas indica]